MRRERGFGVNPWRTHSRFLVSHNLLIDPTYADPLREWLGPMLPGSLLILDEAHHAAPVERRALRHRDEVHPRRPRPRRPLRAPPLPLGDAAQRPLEQLLDAARAPRPVPLHPRRQGARQEGARGRDGAPAQGGHPRGPGRLPAARSSSGSRSTACPTTRPSSCSRASSTSTAPRARSGSRARIAPGTGRRGPARRRPAAAPALVDRGVRAQPQGPPRDGRAPVEKRAAQSCRRQRARSTRGASSSPGARRRRRARRVDRRGARGRGDAPQIEAVTAAAEADAPRDAAAAGALAPRAGAPRSRCRRSPRRTRHLPDAKVRAAHRLDPREPVPGPAARSAQPPTGAAADVERPPRPRSSPRTARARSATCRRSSSRPSRAPTAPTSASR